MTIIEAVLKRRVSRLFVSLEMILIALSLPVFTYALARAGMGTTLPMMATGGASILVIRFYVRALRLDESALGEDHKKVG